MKYGVVIVAYHSFERVVNYLRNELPKLGDEAVIAVVNNAATAEESTALAIACQAYQVDGTEKRLPENQRIFLLHFEENLGYGKGNNRGAFFLIHNFNVQFLLFSNDDIEVQSNQVLNQLSLILDNNPEMKIIGPRVVGLTGRDQSPHWKPISLYREVAWNLLFFLRRPTKHAAKKKDLIATTEYCYWVSGAFFLVDAAAFLRVGGFDENVFLYNEEKILSERFLKHGWLCGWTPDVTVLHYEGASTDISVNKRALLQASSCYYYQYYRHYSYFAIILYQFSAVLNQIIKQFIRKK